MLRRRLALFFFISLAALALAQNNINIDQGLKPYDTWHGGDIDSVSMTNGGLFIKIPLASFPQRGNLDLSFFARFSSKQWQKHCGQRGCGWAPTPNTGTQIVSSLDWWLQNSDSLDSGCGANGGYDLSRGVTSPDGNTHQLGAIYCEISDQPFTYPLRSLDATGILTTDANTVILP